MKVKAVLFLAISFLISCNEINSKTDSNVSDEFKTNYGKIDDTNLKLKFGDVVEFNIENQKVKAIILDIKQENYENWFGLCFINGNKLFGRRIPHGFGGNCVDTFDFTYLNEKGLKNYTILKKEKINFDKVIPGSDSPVYKLEDILRDYYAGIKKRKIAETPCDKKLRMLDPINECYYNFNKILK